MSTIIALPAVDRRPERPAVVALHCSAGSGRQWKSLAAELSEQFTVVAPDLIGSAAGQAWHGERPFRLADEAALAVGIVDSFDAPVHLVGHSYGGAVALRVAIERPNRIASLSLYEPTAFHVLRTMGDEGRAALAEISNIAASVDRAVIAGSYVAGARRFIDYWSAPGTYDSLKDSARAEIVRFMPKGCLDFRALINERTPLAAYRRLSASTLIMRGETSPVPAGLIIRKLAAVMRPRAVDTVAGAGHMGPVTHPDVVAGVIAAHIRRVQAQPLAWAPERSAA